MSDQIPEDPIQIPDPNDSLSPMDPEQDLMPPTPPKSHFLLKLIGMIAVVGLVFGATYYFGDDSIKARFASALHLSQPEPEAPPAPAAEPVPTAVPEDPSLVLARQLIGGDDITRKTIATELANLEGSRLPAIQFFTEALTTAAPDLKSDIIMALGLLAKKDPEALNPLVTALNDKALRREAIPSLGALGPAAKAAVPILKKIAVSKRESKSIRIAAQKALAQIQGKKPAVKKAVHKRGRTKKK